MKQATWILLRALGVIVVTAVVSVSPAFAHGDGGTDTTNCRSPVTDPGDPDIRIRPDLLSPLHETAQRT